MKYENPTIEMLGDDALAQVSGEGWFFGAFLAVFITVVVVVFVAVARPTEEADDGQGAHQNAYRGFGPLAWLYGR